MPFMNGDSDFDSEKVAYQSWDGIRARMADSSRPEEGRVAGVWAIDQLRAILGEHWSGLQDSNYLQIAFMNADAFGQLLDLALRLRLLSDTSGMAKIRRELIKNVKPERRHHTQLLLNVASLAVQCGQEVAMEKTMPSKTAPTDLAITNEFGTFGIEVFAVGLDISMRTGMIYSERIDDELDRIRLMHDVEITGGLDTILTELETQEWLALIGESALRVSEDGEVRTLKHPVGSVTILPRKNSSGIEISFTGPLILGKPNARLFEKLVKKAQQAVNAGATWIRVDILDGLWQFTPWAAQSIYYKGEAIAAEATKALSKIVGLHGAVMSSGSVMCYSPIDDEFVQLSGGGFAMSVNLPLSRARETIIIPLQSECEKETALWVEMYKGEPIWLDWALKTVGLPQSTIGFT